GQGARPGPATQPDPLGGSRRGTMIPVPDPLPLKSAADALDCVLAVDVGGTSMKGAVVAADYAVLDRERRPTPVADGVDAVVEAIASCVAALAERAEAAGQTPRAVGLAVPGVVDDLSGIARFAANIGWDELPLAELNERRTGLQVAHVHDV